MTDEALKSFVVFAYRQTNGLVFEDNELAQSWRKGIATMQYVEGDGRATKLYMERMDSETLLVTSTDNLATPQGLTESKTDVASTTNLFDFKA